MTDRQTVAIVKAPEHGDVATYCDKCSGPITYDETAIMHYTGEVDEETATPVVQIICMTCDDASESTSESVS